MKKLIGLVLVMLVLGAHGVLEPRGRDAERLAATSRLIGGRIRL